MKKMLVVYYSWSNGNTKRIAEQLTNGTGADIARIETTEPYSGSHEDVVEQGKREVEAGFMPQINPISVNLADYDVIAIGTPTWWYTMAPAVLTFLTTNDFTGKTVIPFMTNGGWPGHVIKDMKENCKGAAFAHEIQIQFDSKGKDHLETSEEILICIAGRGYYQEEGKEAVEMKPGDCVNIPAEVKHWHGAAPDEWFSHLAIENYKIQLRKLYHNKDTILSDMDSLDYEDKHYQRRKTDLENHLYKTYDKIDDAEELLVSAKAKKRSLLADKITGDNIYKALVFFDKLYAQMNEAEKREFLSQLVDNVQIYEERKENGQWLKSIEFKLPIIEKEFTLSLDNDTQNETVVLLSKGAKGPVDLCSARTEVERRMVDSRKVKVDFSLEDMDLSEFKGKATYE